MSLKDSSVVNPSKRKRVAIVISNPAVSSTTSWRAGFWWSELTHLYYAFNEKGYELAIPRAIWSAWGSFTRPHLWPWLRTQRRFRPRDQDGRIVKEFDHLMDAFRYLIMSGRDRMKTQPRKPQPQLVYEYLNVKNALSL